MEIYLSEKLEGVELKLWYGGWENLCFLGLHALDVKVTRVSHYENFQRKSQLVNSFKLIHSSGKFTEELEEFAFALSFLIMLKSGLYLWDVRF